MMFKSLELEAELSPGFLSLLINLLIVAILLLHDVSAQNVLIVSIL